MTNLTTMVFNSRQSSMKTYIATSGAATAYPSGAPQFTPAFSGIFGIFKLFLQYVLSKGF
jgi:hypothetical protein